MMLIPFPLTGVAVGEIIRGRVTCKSTEFELLPTQFLEMVMKSYSIAKRGDPR